MKFIDKIMPVIFILAFIGGLHITNIIEYRINKLKINWKQKYEKKLKPEYFHKDRIVHVIKEGETLSFLANLYNVDGQLLQRINHLQNEYELQIGQEIIIPFFPYKSQLQKY